MTKEHEITIRMPEYSPEIVWNSGVSRGWKAIPAHYIFNQSKYPGDCGIVFATRDAAIKADELDGFSGEPYSRPLERMKEVARQGAYDWLLVFDYDMEVLDAYQL